MTNDEIIEAQKLIADIRNVLSELAGITDADKLTALVLEKVPPLCDSYLQLHRLVIKWKEIDGRKVSDDVENLNVMDRMQTQLVIPLALAQMAQLRPEGR